MPCIRTRDILDLSKGFYKQMRLIYEELNDQIDMRPMEAFLDVIRRHVGYLETEILSLEKEATPKVLDAWFQFSPEPPELNIDPTARIGPDMTIDDIFCIVFDFDSALVEFYQKIAESTELVKVREIFFDLLQNVKAEKEKLALHTSGLNYCFQGKPIRPDGSRLERRLGS